MTPTAITRTLYHDGLEAGAPAAGKTRTGLITRVMPSRRNI
jgi:hypothetical protein